VSELQATLTDQERRVLEALADGHSAGETGRRLYISVATVRTHRTSLLRKLGARNAPQAVAIAYQRGLLSVDAAP
jgi:DNA-binding CsgD family transcriptional regulator